MTLWEADELLKEKMLTKVDQACNKQLKEIMCRLGEVILIFSDSSFIILEAVEGYDGAEINVKGRLYSSVHGDHYLLSSGLITLEEYDKLSKQRSKSLQQSMETCERNELLRLQKKYGKKENM